MEKLINEIKMYKLITVLLCVLMFNTACNDEKVVKKETVYINSECSYCCDNNEASNLIIDQFDTINIDVNEWISFRSYTIGEDTSSMIGLYRGSVMFVSEDEEEDYKIFFYKSDFFPAKGRIDLGTMLYPWEELWVKRINLIDTPTKDLSIVDADLNWIEVEIDGEIRYIELSKTKPNNIEE